MSTTATEQRQSGCNSNRTGQNCMLCVHYKTEQGQEQQPGSPAGCLGEVDGSNTEARSCSVRHLTQTTEPRTGCWGFDVQPACA